MEYSDYFKRNKNVDIDVPRYVLYFITTIVDRIDNASMDNIVNGKLYCEMYCKYIYDVDCIAVVRRTVKFYGYDIRIFSYKVVERDDGKKRYFYKWEVSILNEK